MPDNIKGPVRNPATKRHSTTSGSKGLQRSQGTRMKGAVPRSDGLRSYPRRNEGRGKPTHGGK